MPFVTRQGTKVRNPKASALAIIAEIYRDADEYVVYKDSRIGDPLDPNFDAMEGDHLLIHDSEISGMCFVLNLTTGNKSLLPWNFVGNFIKPFEPRRL